MNKKQITNMEVKKNNRNRVYRYICKHGIVSNPDISYETKMSLPTVTQITKELIERGLIEEVGELSSTGGRRAKALSVSANVKQAIGLDITKNHVSLVLTNIIGEILKYERFYKPFEQLDRYYRELSDILESFLDECQADREKILGMGISFPGIVDMDKNMISHSHILGISFVPFDYVSQFFEYPCIFINDANAGAYAEGIGSERSDRFFYLSLSNTVGGGIFSSDDLVQGKNFRCGEVGHMTIVPNGKLCYCGKGGCLDAYCSAKCLSDVADGKLEQFFEKLRRGDRNISGIWDQYTSNLAVAINNIHMILDCDIILGGYIGSFTEEYLQDIWRKVSERNIFTEKECYIKSCNYKLEAAAQGASLRVIESFIEKI